MDMITNVKGQRRSATAIVVRRLMESSRSEGRKFCFGSTDIQVYDMKGTFTL